MASNDYTAFSRTSVREDNTKGLNNLSFHYSRSQSCIPYQHPHHNTLIHSGYNYGCCSVNPHTRINQSPLTNFSAVSWQPVTSHDQRYGKLLVPVGVHGYGKDKVLYHHTPVYVPYLPIRQSRVQFNEAAANNEIPDKASPDVTNGSHGNAESRNTFVSSNKSTPILSTWKESPRYGSTAKQGFGDKKGEGRPAPLATEGKETYHNPNYAHNENKHHGNGVQQAYHCVPRSQASTPDTQTSNYESLGKVDQEENTGLSIDASIEIKKEPKSPTGYHDNDSHELIDRNHGNEFSCVTAGYSHYANESNYRVFQDDMKTDRETGLGEMSVKVKPNQTSTHKSEYVAGGSKDGSTYHSSVSLPALPAQPKYPVFFDVGQGGNGNGSRYPSTSTTTSTDGSTNRVDPSKPVQQNKHVCDECGRSFTRSSTLVTHKRIHTGEKPFSCEICGRAFRQPGNLSRHRLTHTTSKPYVCPHCNKAFNRASNLHTHMRTHSDYKPYECEFCNKRFHQKVDMKIHRYTHTGEKPHKCSVCGRGFKQLTHLTYHMRTHSDVRMYQCEFCGKGFNQKGNLQAHRYRHTGERPFKCDVCGKGFTLASTRNTHIRTHAPKKPFECQYCDKAFYQKNALKTHYIASHPYAGGVLIL